ncbi:hypothetical protein IFM53868_05120 [Aspergillus udagawae]|uniref:Uncharacterized protein n=1 Tax=Aspergillus udagawae TaxID=91492 RepID=A0ABQ1AT29_9EURO|nr:hypothetical protein IFM53868_05120 [Aspergillus udagawae]
MDGAPGETTFDVGIWPLIERDLTAYDKPKDGVQGPPAADVAAGQALQQHKARLSDALRGVGVDVLGDDERTPFFYATLTVDQIRDVSMLQVVGLIFFHDKKAVPPLTNSINDARSHLVHRAGQVGRDIRVAVQEMGPSDTSNLIFEGCFKSRPADWPPPFFPGHGRLVCSIIKNVALGQPRGYAPACFLFSVNTVEHDALRWALKEAIRTDSSGRARLLQKQTQSPHIMTASCLIYVPTPTPAVAGAAALLQVEVSLLKKWPEAVRAILFASANRHKWGTTWWTNVATHDDSPFGAGALDVSKAFLIAQAFTEAGGPDAWRGWYCGTLRWDNIDNLGWVHRRWTLPHITQPRRLKVAIAWDSKTTPTPESSLEVNLDLFVRDGTGRICPGALSYDNSCEIIEVPLEEGDSYELCILCYSGARRDMALWLDIDSFNSVIRLLCAYKNDIHNMSEIYELLRGLQVGFRAPTEVDENAVLQQYPPLADNLGRQLLHLDA